MASIDRWRSAFAPARVLRVIITVKELRCVARASDSRHQSITNSFAPDVLADRCGSALSAT